MDTSQARKMPNIALASQSLRRSGPVTFIKEVITGLKKVTWPTRQETIKLTVIVVVISAVVAGFIGGLDYLFVTLTAMLFKR